MPRIQGLIEEYLTDDKLLKGGGASEIHHIVVATEGATAGQKIVFRNGLDNSAQPLLVVVLEVANGTWPLNFPQGKRFDAGCFVDFQASAGKVHLSLTHK